MPNAYILNKNPAGYGEAVSLLAEMLVGAGWTYQASGDGLAAYNATGKVFTGTAAGATRWNNARAWCRLQDPSALREIVLQHDAAAGLRVKYSCAAKFTGGAPSATVTPSATDERGIQGGGSDASPTYCSAFFATRVASGTDRFQGAALAAAPHGFWFAGCPSPSALTVTSVLMMDPVISVPEDPDPVVWYACRSTNSGFIAGQTGGYGVGYSADYAAGGTNVSVWGFMNAAKTAFVQTDPVAYITTWRGYGSFNGQSDFQIMRGGYIGANPFNGKDEGLPIAYMRRGNLSTPGLKGWSTLARWAGINRNDFLDTMDNRNWICVGRVWLPWDGITDPMN